MNIHAIYHRPDSEYCYPLDPSTLRIVLRTARGEKFKEVGLLWNNKYDFCKRRQFSGLQKRWSDELYDYYFIDLTCEDVRFAYIFLLGLPNGEEYYFSEEGLSKEYDFARGYYTFFQYAFINRADVTQVVPWARDAVVYEIFPDRFCRGDRKKDGKYITQEWDEVPTAKSYAGGDLKGILLSLDRLKKMGVNALYLTPVFRSPSNHKYNVTDYLTVDPMFGTDDDLRELIGATHARGMRLIIDCVFNHCDESNALFADVKEKGRASEYYDWFIVHGPAPSVGGGKGGGATSSLCNYEIFADCPYMPKWNTSNPRVRKYLTGIALAYLSWGFDGLRLDVADEVSHTFWRELRVAVKAAYPEAILIGEVWHENAMYLGGDEFDGVMNYKLQKVFLDYFAVGSITAEEAAARINRIWVRNPRQNNEMMLNFLDNHDTPRFLRMCGENTERLKQALAALYFCVGMPCVFYGTELPLTGDGDPDCRRTYDGNRFPALCGYLTELAAMRAGLPQGDMYAAVEKGALVLVREGKTERVKAYFGNGAAQTSIKREKL